MKIAYTPSITRNQKIKRRPKNKQTRKDWKEKFKSFCIKTSLSFIAVISIVLGIMVIRFVRQSNYFALQTVQVNHTEHISKDEIIIQSGILPRTNLAKIPENDIEKKIAQNPWVKSVQLIKQYPATVSIRVVERKAVALVVGHETWGIDDAGYLLPGLQPDAARELPLITVKEDSISKNATRINTESMRQALSILAQMKRDKPEILKEISEINITHPDNITLYTLREGTEIRLGNKRLSQRLEKFYKAWELAQSRQIVEEYIDLRFEDQGVVTKPKIMRNQKKRKGSSQSA